MKKALTLFLSSLLCLASAYATDYTGNLVIRVGDEKPLQQNDKVVSVELTDMASNLYKISIKNFAFGGLSLGDIVLKDVQGECLSDGSVKLSVTDYQLKVTLVVAPVDVKVTLEATISADGKEFTTQKLDINEVPKVNTVACYFSGTSGSASAIGEVTLTEAADYKVYNLAGQEVKSANAPGVYIIRYANGSAKKIVKK